MSLVGAGCVLQEEECLASLQENEWDVPSALRQIKLDSLIRCVTLQFTSCKLRKKIMTSVRVV